MPVVTLDETLSAADKLHLLLASLEPATLRNQTLQTRIRDIADFEDTRECKRRRVTEGTPSRKRRELERAVLSARWTEGSPLFANFTFEQTRSGSTPILAWYKAIHASKNEMREKRILLLLLEAFVYEEAEVKGVATKRVYQGLSETTGWGERMVKDKVRGGRWYTRFLENEQISLGALAILGDKNSSVGERLSTKDESINEYTQWCLQIEGFENASGAWDSYVYDGINTCLNNLHSGPQPYILNSENPLRCILDRCNSGSRLETSPQRQSTMHRPAIPAEEQGVSSTLRLDQANIPVSAQGTLDAVAPCLGSPASIYSVEKGVGDKGGILARNSWGTRIMRAGTHVAPHTGRSHAPRLVTSWQSPGLRPPLISRAYVRDTAPSILLAMRGDIDGLKELFSRRLASPNDTSVTREFTLVRWALYGGAHNFKTVQFLLEQGAAVDRESYVHVWDLAYRGICTVTTLDGLKCITLCPPEEYQNVDWVNTQQYPAIHDIVLGRSKKPLADELRDNPAAVHSTDATGRTALCWATARAQLADMKLLIAEGSPLNTIDTDGRSTILHAVDSHNDHALRILLEAGADANPKASKRSSPLVAAAFGGLPTMVQLLVEHGADVNVYNPEGSSALQVLASQNTPSATQCAKFLIDGGADPNDTGKSGSSCLEIAISNNSHDVLRLFMNYTKTHNAHHLLLPIIVKCADAPTMAILASNTLLETVRMTWATRNDAVEGFETLRSRADYNNQLYEAFQRLCMS